MMSIVNLNEEKKCVMQYYFTFASLSAIKLILRKLHINLNKSLP